MITYHKNPRNGAMVHYFSEMDDFMKAVHPHIVAQAHEGVADGLDNLVAYMAEYHRATKEMTFDEMTFTLRDRLFGKIGVVRKEGFHLSEEVNGPIDMGAYLSGEPECIMNSIEVEGNARKSLTIMISLEAMGWGERARLRGAAYMALIDALETSGQYLVSVLGVIGSGARRIGVPNFDVVIRLKEAGRAYDPQAYAYAVCNGNFTTKFLFAYFDVMPMVMRRYFGFVDRRHGYAAHVHSLPPTIDETNCAINASHHDSSSIWDEESALAWVQAQLDSYLSAA